MSENADRRHSTVRWRTEEGVVRLNAGTLESASAFESSSTRGKARLPDTSDKPCRPGAHVENITAFESEVEANEWIANDFEEWLERRKKG
jgi:hypothetical protein